MDKIGKVVHIMSGAREKSQRREKRVNPCRHKSGAYQQDSMRRSFAWEFACLENIAVHLFAHHKTACLLTLSPLACHEAACSEPIKRRFRRWSGRRDSNPRQPAWKAVCHKITARSA